jgi:hypothetical protein
MRLGRLGPGGKALLIAAQIAVAILVYSALHTTVSFFVALIAGAIVRVWLLRKVFR